MGFLNPVSTPDDLVWKNRILIFTGPSDLSSWLDESQKKDLADRKLLYFFFKEGRLVASNFEGEVDELTFLKKLNPKIDPEEKWVLIGLDGGIKKSGYSLPKPDDIFKIIDAMPMRQSEIMRRD